MPYTSGNKQCLLLYSWIFRVHTIDTVYHCDSAWSLELGNMAEVLVCVCVCEADSVCTCASVKQHKTIVSPCPFRCIVGKIYLHGGDWSQQPKSLASNRAAVYYMSCLTHKKHHNCSNLCSYNSVHNTGQKPFILRQIKLILFRGNNKCFNWRSTVCTAYYYQYP